MAGSHITKFYTHQDKEPVTSELLNKVSNSPLAARKYNMGWGHHNRSDKKSTTSVDCKLATCKNESFSSDTVKNGGVAEIVVDTLNNVEGFINDMVLETSHIDAPTVVEDKNETTAVSNLEKAKPVFAHENNNCAMQLADTRLESNNTLGAHTVEEKEGWFYKWADKYDVWNDYSYTPTKDNEPGSSHTFTGDSSIFKLTKTKHNGKSKTRIVSKVPTSIKSNFYICKRQS